MKHTQFMFLLGYELRKYRNKTITPHKHQPLSNCLHLFAKLWIPLPTRHHAELSLHRECLGISVVPMRPNAVVRSLCVCVYVCVSVSVPVSVYVYICACLCISNLYASVCLWVYVYICVSMCAHICMYVSVCMVGRK